MDGYPKVPSQDVKRPIDNMIEKGFSILVGDANGADKAVQTYLAQNRSAEAAGQAHDAQ